MSSKICPILLRINIDWYRVLPIDRPGLNRETRSISVAIRFKGDRHLPRASELKVGKRHCRVLICDEVMVKADRLPLLKT